MRDIDVICMDLVSYEDESGDTAWFKQVCWHESELYKEIIIVIVYIKYIATLETGYTLSSFL